MSATILQPATMTMAPQQANYQNFVWEAVAAPATTYAAPTYGTTTYAAAAPTYGTTTYAAAAPTYSTVAAPTYAAAPTYMAAPTTITMAAPTVTTMMAAPTVMETIAAPVTYAAPTVLETIAAAPVTYAAPMAMTSAAPSFVGSAVVRQASVAGPFMQQPIQYLAPQVTTQVGSLAAPLAPPTSLTQDIPTPDQIKAQKSQYEAALEKQLKVGIETIQKETAIEKNRVTFSADKEIALLQMSIEEQRNEQMALLDEQAAIRQCELKRAYVERKLQLDNQANGFTLDYQMKAVQTDLAMKQYEFTKTYVKAENQLALDYNKQVVQANTGTTYTVASSAVA